MKHQVYFFAHDGLIKIGYTSQSKQRMQAHRRQYTGLELIGIISGDRSRERELHGKFVAHNVRGEWFQDCQDMRSAIDKIIADEPPVVEAPPAPVTPVRDYWQIEEERKRRSAAWSRTVDDAHELLQTHKLQLASIQVEQQRWINEAYELLKFRYIMVIRHIGEEDWPSDKPELFTRLQAELQRFETLILNITDCNREAA